MHAKLFCHWAWASAFQGVQCLLQLMPSERAYMSPKHNQLSLCPATNRKRWHIRHEGAAPTEAVVAAITTAATAAAVICSRSDCKACSAVGVCVQ
jgi:hypothetical protein